MVRKKSNVIPRRRRILEENQTVEGEDTDHICRTVEKANEGVSPRILSANIAYFFRCVARGSPDGDSHRVQVVQSGSERPGANVPERLQGRKRRLGANGWNPMPMWRVGEPPTIHGGETARVCPHDQKASKGECRRTETCATITKTI